MRTYDEVFEYIYNHAIVDEDNEAVVDLLSKYFADDERFSEHGAGYSLRKGLFISGNIGCGKTRLMELLKENLKCSYHIVSCRAIADMFAKDGDEALDKYARIRQYRDYTLGKNMRAIYPYCFDDLGTEPEKKYYGNDVNVMLEILLSRYDKGDFTSTHITTNLSAEELKQRYGTRLTSRFKEMFNFINFPQTAVDRRR